ncbi:Hypothetical_protein [Hexamita inflata]|uniref:Hypothetical_protein n=1 Tax=Hexamita inflata TaxID=28002 RepID=A0AA86R9Q0_9EUKA|nr:Hypothetical protein HINF_LOCUS56453 [Hexamita inflata]
MSNIFGKAIPDLCVVATVMLAFFLKIKPLKAFQLQKLLNIILTILILGEILVMILAVTKQPGKEQEIIPISAIAYVDYANTGMTLFTIICYTFSVMGQKYKLVFGFQDSINQKRKIYYIAVLYSAASFLDIYYDVMVTNMLDKDFVYISHVETVVLQYLYQILFDICRAAIFIMPKHLFLEIADVEDTYT